MLLSRLWAPSTSTRCTPSSASAPSTWLSAACEAVSRRFRGTITIAEDPTASTVDVRIDTASITTLNSVRDEDLRSEHFLDVERYPTMTYVSTSTRESATGGWLAIGDLSLHGVTRPMEFAVRFAGAVDDESGSVRVAFHADGSIARRDFGLTYELAKEAGGLLVGSDVAIDIDAEAIQAP
jgi:polyisoprenoid-binding protein YceI